MTQKFKGDATELKMEAAAKPAFDLCSVALDSFYDGCYSAEDFLLMLYDEGRMPFSDRVPRDSFVSFITEAIPNFPNTGTFESYLFILKAVFGEESTISFTVPAAGKLQIDVNASTALLFGFQAREFVGAHYDFYDMVTDDGDSIVFQSISGIESSAQLNALLNELFPVGIFTEITLSFFTLYDFIDDGGAFMIDNSGNQLVFYE